MAKTDYTAIIEAAGKKYNVDPALIRSVIGVETGGQANPNTATSETGAVGLGQLMPDTAKALGVTDRTDPTQNINGAAKLLDELLTKANGNVTLALQRYHGGYDTSDWGPRTAAYPGKVYNKLESNMLPGVPQSHKQPAAQNAQTDDDIFAAFGGGQAGDQNAKPSGAQMTDDDIFKSFSAPEAAQTPATPAPEAQPAAGAGDQYALGSGSVSNFIDALGHNAGNVVLGATQTGLHGLSAIERGLQGLVGGSTPVNDASAGLDKFIQNREQNYQQNVPTNAASIAGAGVGQVLPFLATGGAGVITKGGQLAADVAGMLGAGNKTTAVARAAGQAGGSSLLGLLSAGAQPVTDGAENFAQEKGQQAATGAAVGAVIPGATQLAGGAARSLGNTVSSLIRPFTEGGQQKIAAGVLREAAGDAPTAIAQQSVPGVQPTLAEATGNPGLAALQRALASRPGNESLSLRQTANQEARNAYTGSITGSADDVARLQAARDDLTSPMLQQTFANQTPVDVKPVQDAINAVLGSPGGQRDAIKNVMGQISKTLNNVTDKTPASGLVDAQGNPIGQATTSASPDALYQSVRKQIGDMLESQNPEVRSNVKAVQRELLQVRDALDSTIEQGAPGFAAYRQAYAQASQPISALRTLQGMNLLGPDGSAPVTLAKVRSAIGKVQTARDNPNSRNLDLRAVSDDQLGALTNLRDSLMQQQNLNAGQNAVRGSTTAQNLATGSILDAQQPALVRMLLNGTGRSLTTGSVLGGVLGNMVGGPGAGVAGAAVGSQLGSAFGGALRSKAPEVEQRVLQMLLNPEQAASALAPKANRFPLATGKQLNAAATTLSGAEAGKQSR